jgi:Domain of unknown function (DUF4886)
MRRRPPFTVVAYTGLVLAVVVAAFVYWEGDPRVLLAAALVAPFLVGLWFGVKAVWFFVVAFRALSLALALAAAFWWPTVIVSVELALLLAAPTRRFFLRKPETPSPARSRMQRAVRLGAVGLAALAICLVGFFVFIVRDPISGDLDLVRSDRPGVRVLFIGNSLTYYNGMPGMVRDLAKGNPDGPAVFAVQYARGGSTLDDALGDDRLMELIADERWQTIVLQESSNISSRPRDVEADMVPAATALDAMGRARRARTVLFETWGYEDGLPGFQDSYEWMQRRVYWTYRTVGGRLGAAVAPVGEAWQAAVRRRPGIDLWKGDGLHPTRAGSYLTACVLYAMLTGRDPADSSFTAGLDLAEALWLARLADERVR